MCTYLTEQIKVAGSGKGADGWFGLTDASVYFDHPVHASAEHSLNIDFLWPGPSRPPWPRPRPTCSDPRLLPALARMRCSDRFREE